MIFSNGSYIQAVYNEEEIIVEFIPLKKEGFEAIFGENHIDSENIIFMELS